MEQNNNYANEQDRVNLERDFVFLAAFGLNDDLRPNIAQTIEKLQSENITVRMISGDNIYTAIECAKKAGIITEEEGLSKEVCMSGKDFRDKVGVIKKTRDRDGDVKYEISNKQNFKNIVAKLKVLARSTPEDKFTLIAGLRG